MKLQDLYEAQSKLLVVDQSAKDFLDDIEMEMEKVADSFAHEVKSFSTRPAAPDTSKFRAHVSGMIQVESNVHVNGGQYGVPRTYKIFLKIGGGVDHKVAAKIKEELIKRVAKFVDDEAAAKAMKGNAHFYCDDMMVTMGEEDGTNWGGIGFYTRKYSAHEENQRNTYDLGE
jgi:hypothetical protein